MDVSEQGLSMLWLRVVSRGNPIARAKMTEFYDQWICQVKMSDRALAALKKIEDLKDGELE